MGMRKKLVFSQLYFHLIVVSPTIDPGASGSKSVKVNRCAIWHIKCKGEPPPTFSWYKDDELLVDSTEIAIQNTEFQGGSTTMLQVVKAKVCKSSIYDDLTFN